MPLVEFQLEEGITDVEAVRLIETPVMKNSDEKSCGWKQEITETHQTLQIDFENEVEDPFTARLINFEVLLYSLLTFHKKIRFFSIDDSNLKKYLFVVCILKSQ